MEEAGKKAEIAEAAALIGKLRAAMGLRIVGETGIVDGILMGLIASGHVLLEGVPGLAKTLAVRTFAGISGLEFSRIQFTPDLLPGDITGTLIYEQAEGRFSPRKGPIFANVVLADEVNRAPAKVQSALLEAMEEGQVTIGDRSLALPSPFIVLATQNPIEHEGTYPLPEAQLDRFLLKVLVDYPDPAEELEIAKRNTALAQPAAPLPRVLDASGIALLRDAAAAVRLDDAVIDYCVRLVRATRPRPAEDSVGAAVARARAGAETPPAGKKRAAWEEGGARAAGAGKAPSGAESGLEKDVAAWLEFGASPRASIHLCRCARVAALMNGRDYVLPEDVKAAALPVLRHRLVLSYEAEAEGLSADDVIGAVLAAVALP